MVNHNKHNIDVASDVAVIRKSRHNDECTCNMLICGCFLFKFQQSTPFEMRNPINVEFIFCCVTFKRGTDFRGDFV